MSYRRSFLLILLAAFAARMAFAIAFPANGGDWATYSTVAANILRGCGVSLSPPEGAECLPHFGGNHLPGQPAFVALAWLVSGGSDWAIRLLQTVVYCLALARLMSAVASYARPLSLTWTVGLTMALSPLQTAWFRYTQTETLSLAAAVWFLGELVASFAERRLRIVPLALAALAATWLRWDGLLLCLPIAIAGFILHPPREAVRRGAIGALIVVLPLAAWLGRNAAAGLPLLPPHLVMSPQIAPSPYGYAAWGATWISEEYQRMGWGWPLTFMEYRKINFDGRAFDSPDEKARVEALVARLAAYEGKPFPPDIDAAFAQIARERAAREPVRTYLVLPAKRAAALWSNPMSSFGWPNEMPLGYQERLNVSRRWDRLLEIARGYPVRAATKALTGSYRFALIAAFLFVLVVTPFERMARHRGLIWTVTAWVVARTLFLAFTNSVETRFTAAAVPALELVVILGLFAWLRWLAPPGDTRHRGA